MYTFDSRIFDNLVELHGSNVKKILAEGDSWFAYPKKYLIAGRDSNIIDYLGDKNDLLIYSTASNGDEAVAMLSGDQKFSLIKRLKHNYFDYLLFSGGGNDIVGKYDFDFFIQEKTSDMNWRDCILEDRVKLKMAHIKSSYEILCELVKDHSENKNIKIVTHTYDFAIPSKKKAELFDIIPVSGPWVYPYLKAKKIIDPNDQKEIIKLLLLKFKTTLQSVAKKHSNLIVVNTQNSVNEDEWRDEIHPNSIGFKKVAEKIYKVLV
jgi:hypothetical protein